MIKTKKDQVSQASSQNTKEQVSLKELKSSNGLSGIFAIDLLLEICLSTELFEHSPWEKNSI